MISVLIERRLSSGLDSNYQAEARSTLHNAYQADGFISGETFRDVHHTEHHYVLSKWRSLGDWQRWYQSDTRQNMMGKLNPLFDCPEKITLLEN